MSCCLMMILMFLFSAVSHFHMIHCLWSRSAVLACVGKLVPSRLLHKVQVTCSILLDVVKKGLACTFMSEWTNFSMSLFLKEYRGGYSKTVCSLIRRLHFLYLETPQGTHYSHQPVKVSSCPCLSFTNLAPSLGTFNFPWLLKE